MYCVKKSLHKRCLITLTVSTLTMDFSNLWNLCYEFTDAYFYTV